MIDVLSLIESRGHWYVTIRPTVYDPKRLSTLAAVERTFRDAHIQLRGWDYPHDPKEGVSRYQDYIQGVVSWEAHHELWRLYQSGQFVHFFALREDWLRDAGHTPVEPETALGTVTTLYTLTEIFAFAARLAAAVPLSPEVVIWYKLRKIGGRRLETFDPMRVPIWEGRRSATDLPEIGASVALPLPELVATSGEVAIDHTLAVFDRFGWSPPRELLVEDQRKLLQRR